MDINEAYTILGSKIDACEYITIGQNSGIDGCITYIQQATGCDRQIARQLIDKYDFLKPIQLSREDIKNIQKATQEMYNKPKCPTCGSTNISKISSLAKAANTAIFGIYGQKRKRQFKCNNCKYEW